MCDVAGAFWDIWGQRSGCRGVEVFYIFRAWQQEQGGKTEEGRLSPPLMMKMKGGGPFYVHMKILIIVILSKLNMQLDGK